MNTLYPFLSLLMCSKLAGTKFLSNCYLLFTRRVHNHNKPQLKPGALIPLLLSPLTLRSTRLVSTDELLDQKNSES